MGFDPLVFEPYLRPQIWGGRNLARFGKLLPNSGPYGESWEVSGHPHHVSVVAEGQRKGCSLTQLWAEYPIDIFGDERRPPIDFPLLIKLLDCQELLSVQVHPDDRTAARLRPGERGKTEAWIVLEAAPSAEIFAGLNPGIGPAEFRRHIQEGTTGDCLHRFHPRVGDCLYIRAGTVHTLGGGVVVAEVQQSSDATFRLFDWNRRGPDGAPRPLHVEESLESIDWNAGPVMPVQGTVIPGSGGGVVGNRLVESPFFSITRYEVAAEFANPHLGRMSIWMLLEGQANLCVASSGYHRTFRRVETVLIPASCPSCTWHPLSPPKSCQLLCVTLPTPPYS